MNENWRRREQIVVRMFLQLPFNHKTELNSKSLLNLLTLMMNSKQEHNFKFQLFYWQWRTFNFIVSTSTDVNRNRSRKNSRIQVSNKAFNLYTYFGVFPSTNPYKLCYAAFWSYVNVSCRKGYEDTWKFSSGGKTSPSSSKLKTK